MIISTMYGISFAIACVIFGLIIFIQRQHSENIYTFISLIMLFVHFGYFALSTSTNLEEALLAYKITYLDGTIMPYMVLLFIMEVCGLKKNRAVMAVSILPLATYILGLTAGYYDIYYKDIVFHRMNGYSYLERSYGPLHVLGTICVITFMLAPIAPVVYAFIHRHAVSYKYTLACALLIFINSLAYFIQSLLGINFEILPFQYNIMEIFLFYIVFKTSRHDIKRQGYMVKNHMKEYGFVAFDNRGKYLGCDDVASYYFPELLELKIDTLVDNEKARDEFLIWDDFLIDDESIFKYFERDNRVLKCRKKPLVTEQLGNQDGFIIEINNDTEHVRHVEELNQMNRELMEAVEEAKKANESKSFFLSRMSHEIRTPINAIIGMDEIILRETKESRIKPYAKTISSSAKMLLMLINDLLDFSKIESGKMELVEDNYEVKTMLFNAIQMVRQRAISKDLELLLESEGDIPKTLHGDQLKNQQVLINLLTNAIKYTDVGTVTLLVKAKDTHNGIIEMQYDVIDTGIGIKEEDKGVLFDAFTRVDLKHNNSIEGTGLGLSITNSFVQMMGGHITVESEFGKGSIFSAKIPQYKVSDETINDINIDIMNFDDEESNNDKKLYAPDMNILVVDDNKTNLNVFKFLLEPTKANITEADSGLKAIEILEKERFDIIFLDHMMPMLDGIQTLKIIKDRKLIEATNTPVIALTANAISSAREMYLENGFNDYLSKPIEIGKLIEIIGIHVSEDKYSFIDTTEDDEIVIDDKISDELNKLSDLDEFDFEYAIRHLGNAEGVKIIAKEIFTDIPDTVERLNNAIANIEDNEVLNNYQIEVHTLKGNSASIGALLLSKTCRLVEVACIEHNINKIKTLHPILMEEIEKHYERLATFNINEEEDNVTDYELTELSLEELKEILITVRESLEDWDYDAAEKKIKELAHYVIPEDIKNTIADIIEEVSNYNGSYAIDLINEIL